MFFILILKENGFENLAIDKTLGQIREYGVRTLHPRLKVGIHNAVVQSQVIGQANLVFKKWNQSMEKSLERTLCAQDRDDVPA